MYLPQEASGSATNHSENSCILYFGSTREAKLIPAPIAAMPHGLFSGTYHVAVHSDAGWFFAQAQPLSSILQHWWSLLHPPLHCLLWFQGQQNIFPFLALLTQSGGYTVFPLPSWGCFPSLPFTFPFTIGVWYAFPPFFPFCCTLTVFHCFRSFAP